MTDENRRCHEVVSIHEEAKAKDILKSAGHEPTIH